MNIMKKLLEQSSLLMTCLGETIKNDAEEQKGGFLSMLLGTLGVGLLENLLTGKGTITEGEGVTKLICMDVALLEQVRI